MGNDEIFLAAASRIREATLGEAAGGRTISIPALLEMDASFIYPRRPPESYRVAGQRIRRH